MPASCRKLQRILLPIIVLLLWSTTTNGNGTETSIQPISAPELWRMLENKRATVVHVLSRIEFDTQHIPGSINIPVIDLESTDQLPTDKQRPLVFYCMGER
jgi:rhodanese-related sulfurtransferase